MQVDYILLALLNAIAMSTYIGSVIEFVTDTPGEYLVHYCAPYTGAGKCIIPARSRFTIVQEMSDTNYYMEYDDADNPEWIKAVCKNEEENCGERLKGRFSGISFFVSKDTLAGDSIRFIVPPSDETERIFKRNRIKSQSDFEFRYESSGFGSADIIMSSKNQKCVFDSTYVGHNPLGDFLRTLDDMKESTDDKYYMDWQSEPGCLKTTIEKYCNGWCHLIVEESVTGFSSERNEDWEMKLDARMPFDYLVLTILEEAERNLKIHGIVGFSKDWCNHCDEFPMSSYLSLKGGTSKVDDNDLHISPIEKEIELLNQLICQS